MNDQLVEQLGTRLESASRLLLISHIRPDGDAVGSLLGLGHVLEAAGKEVNLVLEDGVPKSFHHLAGVDQVYRQAAGVYDLIIVLDSSDVSRIGAVLDEYGQPDVNIDHHPTNTHFGDLNLVETGAVATAEILYELIEKLDLPLNQPAAEALLTGLITDSLGFRTNNTTPKSFRTAAALQEQGADPSYLHWKALLERPLEAVLYWGQGLSKVKMEGSLIWTTLTLEDREKVGYSGRDDADLVNVLSTISGMDVCVIFIEQKDGTTKISWRAREGFDVSEVAMKFGGGGHKPAAGASVKGELEHIVKDVLDETRKILD